MHLRWSTHAVRLVGPGDAETLLAIAADGTVSRVLSDGLEVPVLDRRFQRLHWPPIRCAGDARALIEAIAEIEGAGVLAEDA